MNKADLIQSAATLQPPQLASVKGYADQRESLPAGHRYLGFPGVSLSWVFPGLLARSA